MMSMRRCFDFLGKLFQIGRVCELWRCCQLLQLIVRPMPVRDLIRLGEDTRRFAFEPGERFRRRCQVFVKRLSVAPLVPPGQEPEIYSRVLPFPKPIQAQQRRVRRRREKRCGLTAVLVEQEDRSFLFAEMNVEFTGSVGGFDEWKSQQLMQIVRDRSAQAIHFPPIDDVTDSLFRAAPLESMTFVGLDRETAIGLAMADHETAELVVAKCLQRGDHRRLAAVVRPDQHRQPLDRFDHRV